jgi:hypothetical protein
MFALNKGKTADNSGNFPELFEVRDEIIAQRRVWRQMRTSGH